MEKLKVFFMTSSVLAGLVDIGYYMIRELFEEDPFFERVHEPSQADIFAFSCGSALVFPAGGMYGNTGEKLLNFIRTFRKSEDKLMILGGNVSKAPASIERYFDILCVGHAFNFMPKFREIAKRWKMEKKSKKWLLEEVAKTIPNAYVPDIHRRRYDPLNLKHSYVEGSPRISYDHYVDWKRNKAFETAEGSYACLATIGCKRKCYFCQPGWVETWDEEADANKICYYQKNLNLRGSHVSWISDNLTDWKLVNLITTASSSAAITSFLRSKHKSRIVRTGIEGYSERIRKIINKSLPNKLLEEMFMTNRNRQFKVFYIDGFPYTLQSDMDEFIDFWGRDWGGHKGRLYFKFTYFNPCHNTPMAWSPIYNRTFLGNGQKDDVYQKIKFRGNRRHRFFNVSTSSRGYLKAMLCATNGYVGSTIFRGREWARLYHLDNQQLSASGESKIKIDSWLESNCVFDHDRGWTPGESLPNDMIDSGIDYEVLLKIALKLEQYVVTRGPERHPEKRSDPKDYKYLEDIPEVNLEI
jgi:hypothetical protein